MTTIRRELTFAGRVQGIGFRFTACQIAARYSITGWVKNLSNGDVQMVIEGKAQDIDKYLLELQTSINGRGYGRIESCSHSSDVAATGDFDGFGIR